MPAKPGSASGVHEERGEPVQDGAALAAALIGRLESLWATMFGGLAVGLLQAVLTPYTGATPITSVSSYRAAAPFMLAIVALLYLSRRRVVSISRAAH